MRIIYTVTTCSSNAYTELFADTKQKPAYHVQKYHRLLIEGFAAHTRVDVVASPPMIPQLMNNSILRLPDEAENGAAYHYIPVFRNIFLKRIVIGLGSFFKTLGLIDRDCVVVVDVLNNMAALGGLLAAKLRGKRCLGIVTDLPDMMGCSRFNKIITNWVIKHCTDYVLLTEAMNSYIGNTSKPYVVLEGHADITMREQIPSVEGKLSPRVCLYAGCISKDYGLDKLIEGFLQARLTNTELHLYGPCSFEEELLEITREEPRIRYGGLLLNTQIAAKEMEATLLVNPRPTTEEFVKYSFPSKTMEYMASGTPVLTTVLPGMPEEYYPYVFFIRDESAHGIAQALEEVMALSDAELFRKGCAGRKFVLDTRNNVVQAGKILEMLGKGVNA